MGTVFAIAGGGRVVASDVIWLRPEKAATGRPASRSRAEIAAAAVELADRAGLDAVTMHQLARELGTRAPTLYRYVDNRDELLDLMADHVIGEFDLGATTGDWSADLVRYGLQAREVHRRHPWLAGRITTRPGVGPNGAAVLEFFLAALAGHPADDGAKLVAWGMLNALVMSFVQNERADPDLERNAAYLAHLAAAGTHPHIAALAAPPPDPGRDHLAELLPRLLAGLLPELAPGEGDRAGQVGGPC